MTTPRIVSLIPSATEIVCALGFQDALVGRSHECDFPADVTALPVCTEPKFDPHGTSSEINQRVQTLLRDSLSVYRVHEDMLKTLAPDFIITQAQCEVCAVSLDEVERVACDFLSLPSQIVSLEPNALDDVLADIERVAAALGVRERGRELVTQMRRRMGTIVLRTTVITYLPTVATIEWIQPLMAAGNWMPELIEMAGGSSLFGEPGQHSPWITWDDLREEDPDVLVILPCGFDIARTRAEMSALTSQPGWSDLRAVRSGHVYLTDGNQYFNRPGPRLVESLEILAEILHPDAFYFGHEGIGWQRFEEPTL